MVSKVYVKCGYYIFIVYAWGTQMIHVFLEVDINSVKMVYYFSIKYKTD